jgi:glycosyltransferase involved in cell wall biosynthesis
MFMKIGIAGPVDLNILKSAFDNDESEKISLLKGLGGTQPAQYALELMEFVDAVVVYTTSPCLKHGEVRKFSTDKLTLYVAGFTPGRIRVLTFQAREISAIKRMITADMPDVIHAQWSYEFAMAAIYSGIPHIITVRDWAPGILLYMKKPYRLMRLFISFYVFMVGKRFVANSPYLHDKLSFLGRRRLLFVPNSIPNKIFKFKEKIFSEGRLNILSISNGSDSRKNTKTLVKGFASAFRRQKNIHLRLVGRGHEPDSSIAKWAREHEISDNIDFVGPLDFQDVLDELDFADLMIHPSLEESFGNTLVEAMARGVPLVAGERSGAVPWVVSDAGVLVDVSDADALAEAIEVFVSDRSLLKKYSSLGYQNAYRRFSMSTNAKRYTKYYTESLESKII